MAYSRFPNLREMFHADLTQKLLRNVVSLSLRNRECNCRDRATKGCRWGGDCRAVCVIYRAHDLVTQKDYLGHTQQQMKKRGTQHLGQTNKQIRTGKHYDSFSDHFARVFQNFHNPSNRLMLTCIQFTKVWQGNPITCSKTFGTPRCQLCNREKLYIFNTYRKAPDKLINHRDELTSTCRHKPLFHRLMQQVDQH